jgi:hypothetical protein
MQVFRSLVMELAFEGETFSVSFCIDLCIKSCPGEGSNPFCSCSWVWGFFLLELQQFYSEKGMLEILPLAGFLAWTVWCPLGSRGPVLTCACTWASRSHSSCSHGRTWAVGILGPGCRCRIPGVHYNCAVGMGDTSLWAVGALGLGCQHRLLGVQSVVLQAWGTQACRQQEHWVLLAGVGFWDRDPSLKSVGALEPACCHGLLGVSSVAL